MTSLLDDDEKPSNPVPGNVSSLPEPIPENPETELANQVAIQLALDENEQEVKDYQEAVRQQEQEFDGAFPQNFEDPEAVARGQQPGGQGANPQMLTIGIRQETNLQPYHKAIGQDAFCCYCIEIIWGLKFIAIFNMAVTIWYCAMPFVLLVDTEESDASLQLYKWITFLMSLVLVLPTMVICRWLSCQDTRENRKRMHKAYLAILLWNIIRVTWIIGGSWLVLHTSVYWYIVKLEQKDKNNELDIKQQEDKKNDEFVTIQILELFFLTLFYWYFWQVAQRFTSQYNRSSRYLPDNDPHNQIPTERQLNTDQMPAQQQ